MSKPGTRHFIGPLTEKQQQRRRKSRDRWECIASFLYAYNISANLLFKKHYSEFRSRAHQQNDYRV